MPEFTEQQIWNFSSDLRAAHRGGKLAADQIALLESAGFQFDDQLRKPVVCMETATMYPSIAAAAKAAGLKMGASISACLMGKQKTAAGYHWRHATDEEIAADKCLSDPVTDLPEIRKYKSPVVCVETAVMYESIAAAAKALGLKTGTPINACLAGKTKSAGGFHWRYATDEETEAGRCLSDPVTNLPEVRKNKKPVVCRDTATMYPSIAAAAKALGLKTGGPISLCLMGKAKSAGGYHWRYATDKEITAGICLTEPMTDLPDVKKAKRPVVCMETATMYPSGVAAAKAVGLRDISACLRGKQKTAAGYHWRHATDEEIVAGKCLSGPVTDLPETRKYKRPVVCMETATMYPSMRGAARAVGLEHRDSIKSCLDGKGKTAAGYHWRYATDEEIAAGKCLSEPVTYLPKTMKGSPVVCMETATMYGSQVDAARALGLKTSALISDCLRGKQKSAGGYHWRYATNKEIAAGYVIPDENQR